MTIKEIYQLAIKMGMKNDLRPKKEVEREIKLAKEKYKSLNDKEKKYFDKDSFFNPYGDTRILIDKPGKQIKKVLAGIDIETAEILLADRLGDIDLVIAHHPLGSALSEGLSSAMHLQIDLLNQYGIPINVAEKLIKKSISEVSRVVSPLNHFQAIQASKALGLGFMCSHTACDNLAAKFIEDKLNGCELEYLEDVVDCLMDIDEFECAKKDGHGPYISAGEPKSRVGKIALTEITGGTEPKHDLGKYLAIAGVGTILAMHLSEENRKYMTRANINVVVTGHSSADSIGVNLFLDELEKRGVEIVACGGLTRISRARKKKK